MALDNTPYHYDRSVPLAIELASAPRHARDSVVARDLSYASTRVGRVPALLVVPTAAGPHAAVLFFHHGGRQTVDGFLAEATALAAFGMASLFIDAPWLRAEQVDAPYAATAFRLFEQAGVDLLRGAEVLASLPDVDAQKIGFVGHGFGAHLGALVAARSLEVKAAVLIAGSSRISRQMLQEHPIWHDADPSELEAIADRMAPIDAERFIGQSRVPIFHQFGSDDPFVSDEEAHFYFSLTPDPKVMRFYPSDHGLADPLALADRRTFLRTALDLPRTASTEEARLIMSERLSHALPPSHKRSRRPKR